MNKLLLIAASVAAGLITYLNVTKRLNKANKHSETKIKPHQPEHHITNVFAKAKKHAVSQT